MDVSVDETGQQKPRAQIAHRRVGVGTTDVRIVAAGCNCVAVDSQCSVLEVRESVRVGERVAGGVIDGGAEDLH